MSLIYRRKSAIFQNPEQTSEKLRIQELLTQHKIKFKINNRTCSRPKPKQQQIEKLSLAQALKL
jgi:hypothetical protein